MEPTFQLYKTDKIDVAGRSCNMSGSGPLKLNQDAYTFRLHVHNEQDYVVVVMCDGHGQFGHLFAKESANDMCVQIIADFEQILKEPIVRLAHIFTRFNQSLKERIRGMIGGTTISVLIKTRGREIVANLGDCDVYTKTNPKEFIHGYKHENYDDINSVEYFSVKPNGLYCLSENHGGTSDREVLRVLSHTDCAFVYNTPYMDTILHEVCEMEKDKVLMDDAGKIKRVPYNTVPGISAHNVNMDISTYFYHKPTKQRLNIGRSFGDYTQPFVIDCPSVCIFSYNDDTPTTTIIGTDGYFNCVKDDELLLQMELSPFEICENAVRFVEGSFGVEDGDNMTLVAIKM